MIFGIINLVYAFFSLLFTKEVINSQMSLTLFRTHKNEPMRIKYLRVRISGVVTLFIGFLSIILDLLNIFPA